MEIKLHYPPEKPYTSCNVLVFHLNEFGDIYCIQNVGYSAKYGLFNCHDFYDGEDVTDMEEYGDDLVAWAYMDEVTVEVNRCLRNGK